MFIRKYPLMEEAGEGGGAGSGAGSGGEGAGGEGAGEGGGEGAVEWRGLLAGEDAALAKRLERFTNPTDFAKSWLEKDQIISRGEVLKPLPENATEDDIKAFRERQGIPAEHAGYLEGLPEGLVIGEDDRDTVDSFAKAMHSVNAPPSVVQAGLAWYNEFMDAEAAAQEEADATNKQAMEDEMREEWGADYRANVNVTQALLAKYMDDDTREFFMSLRGPDGKAALHHPGVAKMLVSLGREINPIATILPADKASQKGLTDRLTEIRTVMRTDRAKYDKDAAMQKEFEELLTVEQRMKERNEAA